MILTFMVVLTSIFIIIPCSASADRNDIQDAGFGITPTIDGFISTNEWDDANFIQYTLSGDVTATVYFKEDGEALYVAFDIPTEEYEGDDSGIMFDIDNDGGDRPQRDDIVIQQRRDGSEKRERIGTGLAWISIPSSGWTEETSSSETGWQIEYSIDYAKLNINPDESKTLGIGFHILDNGMEYDWPINPCFNIPDSWADMSSSNNWSVVDNQYPAALADADPISGQAPLTVSFTGTGADYDGEVQSYYWDFDDDTTSNEQHPIHIFKNAGTYTVKLTVTDDDGATGSDTIEIAVTENDDDNDDTPTNGDTSDDKPAKKKDDDKGLPAFEPVFILAGILLAMFLIRKRDR